MFLSRHRRTHIKVKMKTVLVAVLLLQLLLQSSANPPPGGKAKETKTQEPQAPQLVGKPKFGDIIGFQRVGTIKDIKGASTRKFTYRHFGIYIDKRRFEDKGQQEGQNLFHITGSIIMEKGKFSRCEFSTVDAEVKYSDVPAMVFNYLDDVLDKHSELKIGTDEDFEKRIREKIEKCKSWKPYTNNCEHLATNIHYGVPISLQVGMTEEGKCFNKDEGLSREKEQEILKDVKPFYTDKWAATDKEHEKAGIKMAEQHIWTMENLVAHLFCTQKIEVSSSCECPTA